MNARESATADSRLARRLSETGHWMARMGSGIQNIGPLYDHHAKLFGVEIERLKPFVISGLREKASWEAAHDAFAKAAALAPANVSAQEDLALLLEQMGRFEDALQVRRRIAQLAPASPVNQLALGRLYERTLPWKDVSEHCLTAFKASDWLLLAECRQAALYAPSECSAAALIDLKSRVDSGLAQDPGTVTLHLARAFIDLAGHDLHAAAHSFLRASVLAEWTAAPPHANPWKALEQNYLHRFNAADWLLLAQCRQVALYGARENGDKLLADLKRRIESAMVVPGEATLHLARGFVDIAEHNLTAAAHSFLTASVLAEWASSKTPDPQQLELFDGEQTRQPTEDAWSIAFAHAFLLDMLPSDWSRGAIFVPIDQVRLRLVRAALMRSQSAILPALQQYAAAIDELANQPRPHFYTIYKSYRIVAHQARFYAVPRSNGNFFISDGIVVRRSGLLDEVKPWLSERIDPHWRAFARRIWHRLRGFPYQIKCAVSDRLDPRSRAFARRMWRLLARPVLRIMGRVTRGLSRRLTALLIRIYGKLLAARGVLIDTDVLALRERIDKRDTLARGQIVS